jgi:hypothetical protein
MNYTFDSEGNINNRQAALKEIERIERDIQTEEDPIKVQSMQSRWNYLMTVV